VLTFAARLPSAREQAQRHLELPGLPAERVLATAFRLLDLGLFRIGGEAYADENGSYGLATLRREHVRVSGGAVQFAYTAKSGRQRRVVVRDEHVLRVVTRLKRRRGGGEELLAWRPADEPTPVDGVPAPGRSRAVPDGGWRDVSSDDINAYLKALIGPEASAKDFRTWHATVLAAVVLAEVPQRPRSDTATRREISRAIRVVAEQLGNTPAVCRASYVDPRVLDRFSEGVTVRKALRRLGTAAFDDPDVRPRVERAVLRMLRPAPDPRASPVIVHTSAGPASNGRSLGPAVAAAAGRGPRSGVNRAAEGRRAGHAGRRSG